jgi:hypothetical protein
MRCFQLCADPKKAVWKNYNVAVTFDFANNNYTAFIDNGATCGILDAGETIIKTAQMPQGINLQNAGLDALVRFDRRGFPFDCTSPVPLSVSGYVAFTNGARTLTINLTIAGSSSIQ